MLPIAVGCLLLLGGALVAPVAPAVCLDATQHVLQKGQYCILSPGYPEEYEHNQDLQWTLRGDQGQAISMTCTIDVPSDSRDCTEDYLRVNGVHFCGRKDTVYDNTRSELHVVFVSDNASPNGTGFNCTITVQDGSSTDISEHRQRRLRQ